MTWGARIAGVALLVAAPFAAPVPAPAAPVTPAPSVTLPPELARVLTDYEVAWAAKDAAALAALFAEDGFVLSSGEPPARGRAAIERLYTGRGGPLALRAFDYRTEGSVGYILGAFARQRGDPDMGKFTLTLVKGSGGRWFIKSDMDNGNTPGPMSAPAPPAPAPPTTPAPAAAPAPAMAPAPATAPASAQGAGPGAATAGGGGMPVPKRPDAARVLLDRAVKTAGGARALASYPAFRWTGQAVVHAGGRDIALAGTWRLVPPGQARVETWETLHGPDATRTLILSGDSGFTIKDGVTQPMMPAFRQHEAVQFHLYALMRLVTLGPPDCAIAPLDRDALGREGLRAACAGFPDAELRFDATSSLVRISTRLVAPDSGKEVLETVDLDGVVESHGIRWPRTIRLAWDGAPYFDLEILGFEALKGIDPATFAPPR